ncbi:MAG TPA: flagellin [Methanoregula sp.]|nr:flagellin [Methanoregula sp.]
MTNERAFTGLEAAIVLIAFVVIAAVFSYVVLGTGFFTSQTAMATLQSGFQQASSSIEIVGNVYGIADPKDLTYLRHVNITIALTAGGTPVDVGSMVISYNDNNGGHNANLTYGGVSGDNSGACTNAMNGGSGTAQEWCIAEKTNNLTAGAVLEPDAQMVLVIGLPATAIPSTKFSISFQPATGAVLSVSRTIAGKIDPVQPLY